jgi:hypothetical protein
MTILNDGIMKEVSFTIIRSGKFKINKGIDDHGKDVFILKERDFLWFYHEIKRSYNLEKQITSMENYIKWDKEGKRLESCT